MTKMMLDKGRNLISTKQLFAILVIVMGGTGLIGLTGLVTDGVQQDAWISTLLSGILAFVGMNLILFLLKHFPNDDFIGISEKVLGKYLGRIPGIILFLFYLVFTALALRTLVDLSAVWYLPKTPIEITLITTLGLLFYLTRNGVKVMGRFQQIILWVLVPIIPLFMVPFLVHKDLLMVMPVGGSGLVPILRGIFPAFYAFFGFETIFILYPYVRNDADHKEIVKTANLAIVLVIIFKVFVVFSNIATFGHKEITFFLYPLLQYFKLLSFPVIERLEFFLMYFLVFMIFSSISVTFYMSNLSIEKVLKIEGYKNTGLFLAIPVYYLTIYAQNVGQYLGLVNTVTLYGYILLLASFLLVFGVAIIRGKVKKDES